MRALSLLNNNRPVESFSFAPVVDGPPSAGDNLRRGYRPGSDWTAGGTLYRCLSADTSLATWAARGLPIAEPVVDQIGGALPLAAGGLVRLYSGYTVGYACRVRRESDDATFDLPWVKRLVCGSILDVADVDAAIAFGAGSPLRLVTLYNQTDNSPIASRTANVDLVGGGGTAASQPIVSGARLPNGIPTFTGDVNAPAAGHFVQILGTFPRQTCAFLAELRTHVNSTGNTFFSTGASGNLWLYQELLQRTPLAGQAQINANTAAAFTSGVAVPASTPFAVGINTTTTTTAIAVNARELVVGPFPGGSHTNAQFGARGGSSAYNGQYDAVGVIAYTRSLTAAEFTAAAAGFSVLVDSAPQIDLNVIFQGDERLRGALAALGRSPSAYVAERLQRRASVWNYSLSGAQAVEGAAVHDTVFPLSVVAHGVNVVVRSLGRADIVGGGVTAAAAYQAMRQMYARDQALGLATIVLTQFATSAATANEAAELTAFNNLLRYNSPVVADLLLDVTTIPELAVNDSGGAATYWATTNNLTALGNEILAGRTQHAVELIAAANGLLVPNQPHLTE